MNYIIIANLNQKYPINVRESQTLFTRKFDFHTRHQRAVEYDFEGTRCSHD